MNRFFIKVHGEQKGPFTMEQIIKLKAPCPFLLWTKGMDDWVEIDSYATLREKYNRHTTKIESTSIIEKKENPSTQNTANNTSIKRVIPVNDCKEASIGKRFFAHVINATIYWILVALLFQIFPEINTSAFLIILYTTPKLLTIFTYKKWGGNLGHVLTSLKVVNQTTYEEISPLAGFFREILKQFLFTFLFPVLLLFFNDKKQNLYDMIFSTIVVDKNKF